MKKLLIIGDQCIDRFVYGETKRLSPEAPVPVFTPTSTVYNKGMAGNVAENFRALTQEYEVEEISQPESITKTRFVDAKSNHMFLRVDEGETNIRVLRMTDEIRAKIKEADAVIVSDYDKGFLDYNLLAEIGALAKISFLDSKKILPGHVTKDYTFLKCNEHEYNENLILGHLLLSKVIITLGSKGARHDNVDYPSPQPQETIDVSGAGDTFLAAFVVRYLETKSVSNAIKFANIKAAEVVQKKGVATP